jgi:hypothetical protein
MTINVINHKLVFWEFLLQLTLAEVYSLGNLKLWVPWPLTLGRVPALGITFQDKYNVTFW